MSGTASALLDVRGLTLHAAGRVLLRGLDWRADVGERWCVIGRNAVGKSTLLRTLAGLSNGTGLAHEGEVRWLGRSLSRWPAADAASVRAFMPQQASDRFPISVQRLLALSRVAPRRDVSAVLTALDAAALAARNVQQLSGGERQRVALAQCALQGAPLMLLDEPGAFQDPAHQLQVSQWLATLDDAALVVSAHDVNWIARTATHVLALLGDAEGGWELGPVHDMLQADRLARVYGCAWREVGGVWVAA
jgi:iron complex transport system ATP-binding protein